LEIDTDPPKMEIPPPGGEGSSGSGQTFTFEQLTGELQKIKKEFVIPAELLE
jgi:hypothetical protein